MRETHENSATHESALTPETNVALLPWHSSPRLAFEQLSFATTDGALALAEEPQLQQSQQVIVIAESDPVMASTLEEELRDFPDFRVLR